MIRFALNCANGHGFEGWFPGSEGFEAQKSTGSVSCPVCGSSDVDKSLMTPAVATSRRGVSRTAGAQIAHDADAIAMLRKMREHLTDKADNVGDRFAEEARRIHYDEADKRGIYGKATADEVRSLADEGIEFHPLPVLPEDHH